MAAVLAGGALLLAGSFVLPAWLSWTRHHFGPWDPRVLLFVHSTWTERIGIIEPLSGSLLYVAEGPDGPGVGFLHARYSTRLTSEAALQVFGSGCDRLGLAREPASVRVGEAGLVCRKGDLAIAFSISGQDVEILEDVP